MTKTRKARAATRTTCSGTDSHAPRRGRRAVVPARGRRGRARRGFRPGTHGARHRRDTSAPNRGGRRRRRNDHAEGDREREKVKVAGFAAATAQACATRRAPRRDPASRTRPRRVADARGAAGRFRWGTRRCKPLWTRKRQTHRDYQSPATGAKGSATASTSPPPPRRRWCASRPVRRGARRASFDGRANAVEDIHTKRARREGEAKDRGVSSRRVFFFFGPSSALRGHRAEREREKGVGSGVR